MTRGLKALARKAEEYQYTVVDLGWGITITNGSHTLRLVDGEDLQAICEDAHHLTMSADISFQERHEWLALCRGFWSVEARQREQEYHERNRSKIGRPAPQEELQQ